MSNANRRRNGRQASCEPCRKAKVRCDHGLPACSRCKRRGSSSECWYHPSPLTKLPVSPMFEAPQQSSPTAAAVQTLGNDFFSTSSPGDGADHAPLFHSWPVLSHDDSNVRLHIPFQGNKNQNIYNEQIVAAIEILGPLRHLDDLEQLVKEYYMRNESALVPRPIALRMISLLKEDRTISEYVKGNIDDMCITKFAEALIRASVMPIKILSTTDPAEFCAKYSGPNLRIETVGIIITQAARSIVSKHGYIDVMRDEFAADLVRCSSLSLWLCREQAAENNDVIVWLAFENIQLMSHVRGQTSLSVWRRVNDLTTDVIAVGLHRDATTSSDKTPFFLAEIRRAAFAVAYHLDKDFSASFLRPVGLANRYADCRLPFDLSDNEIFVDSNGTHSASRLNINAEGWNNDNKPRNRSWVRARYILAILREELLDYQLRSTTASEIPKLRGLQGRCETAWNAIPSYLRYTPDCWKSDATMITCIMKTKLYLLYLHIHFQINRLVGKLEGTLLPTLIPTSYEIIKVLAERARVRNISTFSPHDIPEVLLKYGLPAAMVLAISLQNTMRNRHTYLAVGIKRSVVIKDICLFVSQLDSVSTNPQPDHDFCQRAARGLDTILDGILSGSAEALTDATNQPVASATTFSLASEPPFMTMNFNNSGLPDLDALDFERWISNELGGNG